MCLGCRNYAFINYVFNMRLGESHSSASLLRSMQGCWRRQSGPWSNLRFRGNNIRSMLAVEDWTSSIASLGSWRVLGSLPNQSTTVLWTCGRHSTVSFCEGCSKSVGCWVCCYRPFTPYANIVWSKLLVFKSDLYQMRVRLSQGCPFSIILFISFVV